ncbi:hypothetical protein L195_g061526, partial [Trifolium pratense]
DALKCQDILDYIKEAGLLKTVCDFSPCYELLVKEFLVNISEECDNPLSKDYHKLFVRDHVGTSADGAGTMTKMEIIAALKVQCQEIDKQKDELEEKKKMFVKMIEGLEADDAPVKASANVAAAGE